MAEVGWDAVYVSAQGFAANANRFIGGEPSLYGWECASVLWLSGNYRLASGSWPPPRGPRGRMHPAGQGPGQAGGRRHAGSCR